MRWHMKHTICQTQHSLCTGLLYGSLTDQLKTSLHVHTQVGRYIYVKVLENTSNLSTSQSATMQCISVD